MFKAFTFKSFASLAVVTAVVCIGNADAALAKRKKFQDDMQFTTEGTVRDHRTKPIVRDHRTKPIVRDHRTQPIVRDHRAQPIVRDHREVVVRRTSEGGGVTVTSRPRKRSEPVVRDLRRKKTLGYPFWN